MRGLRDEHSILDAMDDHIAAAKGEGLLDVAHAFGLLTPGVDRDTTLAPTTRRG